jgi:hypothetical protein
MRHTILPFLVVAVVVAACSEHASAPDPLTRFGGQPARYTVEELPVSGPPESYPTPEQAAEIDAYVTGTVAFSTTDAKKASTRTFYWFKEVSRFTSDAELSLTKPERQPIGVAKTLTFVNLPNERRSAESVKELEGFFSPSATAPESCGWTASYKNAFKAEVTSYENRPTGWVTLIYRVLGDNNAVPKSQDQCKTALEEVSCDDPITFGTEETCEESQQSNDWATPATSLNGSAEAFDDRTTQLILVRIWWKKTYNRYGHLIAFDILAIEPI